jgi:hypothetical protein
MAIARMLAEAEGLLFVTTPFSGDARHARRIAQLADHERTGELPAL